MLTPILTKYQVCQKVRSINIIVNANRLLFVFLQVCSQTGVLRTLHTENVLVQYKTNALVILTATKIVIINVALMAAGDFAERKLVCRGGREGNTD